MNILKVGPELLRCRFQIAYLLISIKAEREFETDLEFGVIIAAFGSHEKTK